MTDQPTTTETTETETPAFDLNMHAARLLMREPFFAAISRRVNKRATTSVPTAGVTVTEAGQFELVYNPEFMGSLDDAHKLGVLKHEFYHLIFEHVTGTRFAHFRDIEASERRLYNIGMDLAINSHLQGELPEQCCMPGAGPFAEYEPFLSAEQYIAKLREDKDQQQGDDGEGDSGDDDGEGGQGGSGGSGDGQFDSHDGWAEAGDAASQVAAERLKDTIRKAAEEADRSRTWGSVSSSVREDIRKALRSYVDWKKVLRYFIKTSQRANKTSTVRRLNRRYPRIHSGSKVNRQAKIAISIDQSGSVDDRMLSAFYAELDKLATLAEFTVVPFDTEVAEDHVYVWKKGERRKAERVRYGGTDFNPPTEWVNARGFDGHIVLTDLCAPKPVSSKCQRMWMTTRYYAERPYFQTNEMIVAIDTEG
jgi:predicted metal-dependent peptidase